MPIYEYECNACGTNFEELVRMCEEKAPACPRCGKPDTRRLLSPCASKAGGGDAFASGSS